MTLGIIKNNLLTSSLILQLKNNKSKQFPARYKTIKKVSKINKEIKTNQHCNRITVLASFSDTIKTEIHFSDKPRPFVLYYRSSCAGPRTALSLHPGGQGNKVFNLLIKPQNCQSRNTCTLKKKFWYYHEEVWQTSGQQRPGPPLSCTINRHLRAWQVGCQERLRSVTQIINCCTGQ